MHLTETYKITDQKELKIYQDTDPQNPRDWDNLGTMICFHKRYRLGDKHNINHEDYDGWKDMVSKVLPKDSVYLPLYLMDHSGLSMSYRDFGCKWDSGSVGFIYVTKEKIIEEYGSDKQVARVIALKYLQEEVETYDQYLRGDAYFFKVVEKRVCSECNHVEWDELESCGGFLGSDLRKNGILESLPIEYWENLLERYPELRPESTTLEDRDVVECSDGTT